MTEPRPLESTCQTFETLLHQIKATTEAIITWESFSGTTFHGYQLQVLLDHTKNMAMMRITAEEAQKLWESFKDTARPSYSMTLDVAVEALCDIKADEDTTEQRRNQSVKRKRKVR